MHLVMQFTRKVSAHAEQVPDTHWLALCKPTAPVQLMCFTRELQRQLASVFRALAWWAMAPVMECRDAQSATARGLARQVGRRWSVSGRTGG